MLALEIGRHVPPETSVNFYYTTRRDIQEDSTLRSHRRDNLLSYADLTFLFKNYFLLTHLFIYLGLKLHQHPKENASGSPGGSQLPL
jgi:hypothetical protein